MALRRRAAPFHLLRRADLHPDVAERMAGLRELRQQAWQHLLQAYGGRAVACRDDQVAILEVRHLALLGHVGGQCRFECPLQSPQAGGVFLKAGEGVAAAEEAMEELAHDAWNPVNGRGAAVNWRHVSRAARIGMINSRLCRIDVDLKHDLRPAQENLR
ncbi:protein of unknown function [Thauera humireducens]|nr:protein of unknown function [Thauera humireducens]